MSTLLIAIDDGHGSDTAGKRTPYFNDGSIMKENEFNSVTAAHLKKALERCNFKTLFVAPEETDTPLNKRITRANNADADFYISIHANAFGNSWNNAKGIETYIYNMADVLTRRAAELIQTELIQATGAIDRGVKENPELYVLNSTKMTAALVECGFMTNRAEAARLRTAEYRSICAEAICKGICKYFNMPYIPEPTACSLIKIVVDGTEHIIDGLEVTDSDGNITNFAKIRSLAHLLGYDVNSVGAMPVLTKKFLTKK